MNGILSVVLLAVANVFMTLAWYGHLNWKDSGWMQKLGLPAIVLMSWGLAFFEYIFQVPANRIGYQGNGGPFSQVELRTIQEVISLMVFAIMTTLVFKNEKLAWNHYLGFALMIAAVFVVFKKW